MDEFACFFLLLTLEGERTKTVPYVVNNFELKVAFSGPSCTEITVHVRFVTVSQCFIFSARTLLVL